MPLRATGQDIFDFELTEDEMAQIAALDKGKSYFNWPEWFERITYKFSDKTSLRRKGLSGA